MQLLNSLEPVLIRKRSRVLIPSKQDLSALGLIDGLRIKWLDDIVAMGR